MPIIFTNDNTNSNFSINANSNKLVINKNNTHLSLLQSDDTNIISNLVSAFENINNDEKNTKQRMYGQIKYIDLEGGFYGIKTVSNEHYIPINIQNKLNQYNNQYIDIILSYSNKDQLSIYQWGELLYVESYSIIIND